MSINSTIHDQADIRTSEAFIDPTLNTLAHFTSPALIVPELQSRAASDVLVELCSVLNRQGRLTDPAAFLSAVINRESICPTSTAPGWALPHARLPGITQLSFALARSSQPLIWFGEGSIRPQMVFLFAVPEADTGTYLRVVAAVAKLSQNLFLLEQLRAAPNAQTMFEALRQIPLRVRGSAPAVPAAIR